MSTSNWQNISYNIDLVRKLNPKSILDIGVGFGRWGILFREFLEVWDSGKFKGDWERIIDGVEIFPGYIQDYHKYFYNNIFIDDALNYLRNNTKHYDLINFGDVIEHFSKNEGKELIKVGLKKSKYVLINIPIGKYWEQDGIDENPYEQHKSTWNLSDFSSYKYKKIKVFKDFIQRDFSVVLLSSSKIEFDNRFGKHFYLKNFLKHRAGLKEQIEKFEKRKGK